MAKSPKLQFKAGDDFNLLLTVTNKVSPEAVAAQAAVVAAEAVYAAAVAATPQVPLDISSAQSSLDAANAAYAAAIIVDITGWTITSSIRWCGKFVNDFTVTLTDPTLGQFRLIADDAVTQLWKPRLYDVDIQFVISGTKTSSQTFNIDVVRDVTYESV